MHVKERQIDQKEERKKYWKFDFSNVLKVIEWFSLFIIVPIVIYSIQLEDKKDWIFFSFELIAFDLVKNLEKMCVDNQLE